MSTKHFEFTGLFPRRSSFFSFPWVLVRFHTLPQTISTSLKNSQIDFNELDDQDPKLEWIWGRLVLRDNLIMIRLLFKNQNVIRKILFKTYRLTPTVDLVYAYLLVSFGLFP